MGSVAQWHRHNTCLTYTWSLVQSQHHKNIYILFQENISSPKHVLSMYTYTHIYRCRLLNYEIKISCLKTIHKQLILLKLTPRKYFTLLTGEFSVSTFQKYTLNSLIKKLLTSSSSNDACKQQTDRD